MPKQNLSQLPLRLSPAIEKQHVPAVTASDNLLFQTDWFISIFIIVLRVCGHFYSYFHDLLDTTILDSTNLSNQLAIRILRVKVKFDTYNGSISSV